MVEMGRRKNFNFHFENCFSSQNAIIYSRVWLSRPPSRRIFSVKESSDLYQFPPFCHKSLEIDCLWKLFLLSYFLVGFMFFSSYRIFFRLPSNFFSSFSFEEILLQAARKKGAKEIFSLHHMSICVKRWKIPL